MKTKTLTPNKASYYSKLYNQLYSSRPEFLTLPPEQIETLLLNSPEKVIDALFNDRLEMLSNLFAGSKASLAFYDAIENYCDAIKYAISE